MLERSALVISPTPPMPRDYGNRNRIFQTIGFLKSLGYKISMLLYPFDEDWSHGIPDYYKELSDSCDYFAVVPNSRPLHQEASGYFHEIDEWWDENITQHLQWLFKRKKFDILFVNYTFFSAAFNYAPPGVLKILDTHDLFSGRREMFEGHGVSAEFFYTSKEQECIAFNRADVIIAIKQSEANFISSVSAKTVINIPYWDSHVTGDLQRLRPSPARFDHDDPLVVGFIGALNSVNFVNIARFLALFERYVQLYDLPIKVVVAGNVCKKLKNYSFLEKLGRVKKLDDFYNRIDAVIAPLEFSTGIKIKVGESLAWGVPVVATKNAFDGFRHYHGTQAENTVADLCETLVNLATNDLSLEELAIATRSAARAAARAQDRGFSALRDWLKTTAKRIVIVSARPYWLRETFVDELIAQAVEYVSQIMSTTVIVTCGDAVKSVSLYGNITYLATDAAKVGDVVSEISSISEVVALLQCESLVEQSIFAVNRNIRLSWALEATSPGDCLGLGLTMFRSKGKSAEELGVSSLRYLPLHAATKVKIGKVAIYVSEHASEREEILLDMVMDICNDAGQAASVLRVPDDYRYNRQFFIDVMAEDAMRSVLIGPKGWEYLLLQLARYRSGSCLIVGDDYVVPQVTDDEGRPSLVDSITRFVDGATVAAIPADANSGWDAVWTATVTAAENAGSTAESSFVGPN